MKQRALSPWSDGQVDYSQFYKPHFNFLKTSPPFFSLLLLSPELSQPVFQAGCELAIQHNPEAEQMQIPGQTQGFANPLFGDGIFLASRLRSCLLIKTRVGTPLGSR